jgi:macrolide transport system ATP-binding/permease protein
MADATQTTRFRFWLWLIRVIGVIVPRRLRADWRQEWQAELHYREMMLAEWDRLDWLTKLDLLWRSLGAFWDALRLQPRRLEDEMFQDLRFGVRMLMKHKGFTLVAVLSLALGIGANTALFSLVDRLLVRPLPVAEPERLVTFNKGTAPNLFDKFTYPDFADYRNLNQVFDGLVCYTETALNLSERGQTERLHGLLVSGNYFSALHVTPALGRGFLLEEERTPDARPVAVLSYGLWQRRFGADPAVVGRDITLNGQGYTVVGVTPAAFTGTIRGAAPDLYVPIKPDNNRGKYWLLLMGRLKPNVSREQAQVALNVLGPQIARHYPRPDGSPRREPPFLLEDGRQGHTYLLRKLSFPLKLLMGIVALVLLIACANVANLLLVRAAARRKEMAIRLALGAGRGRLVRQLLTESLLLAGLGGGLGLWLAGPIGNLLASFTPPTGRGYSTPLSLAGGLDTRVLVFTFCLSLLAGIVFGLAPALGAVRTGLVAALKDGAGEGVGLRRFNPRKLLVVAQVALSFLVLIGAGLCVRSLQRLQAIDAGFDPAKVLVLSLDLGLSGYDVARGQLFYQQLLERVTGLPGVESASLAHSTPLGDDLLTRRTAIEGYEPQPNENMSFSYNVVGPRFFETLRTPLVSGRAFTPQDRAGAPQVVIINETLQRRYFPNGDALGRRLIFGNYLGSPIPLQHLEIIGVVKDSKYAELTEQTQQMMFLPLAQNYRPEMRLHVRTAQDPPALVAAIRRETQNLDAGLPFYNIKTLAEQKDRSLYTARLAAMLLSVFGGLALLLASIGLYGVMAYVVSQRRREIGVRLALGAQQRDVFRLVLKEGMAMVAVGLALGLAGALAGTRLLTTFLYGVEPTDTATFSGIALLLAAVALVANYLPARRAARTDPIPALRAE